METTRTDLLTGASVEAAGEANLMGGGCCGGGSCACSNGAESTTESVAVPAATAGTEFLVTGMTCGHCVSSVTEEVGAIDGVESVEVVLKKGGASRVTVTSAGPIDADAVRAAVEEAGYQLA
ncbi:heavy-metal-associated domain-containing protein [Microcella sp.]|uniref:heavy-metal-associated domain-containing protein n=1 Tax=Microcella sp. TaxID=1913979 RepID=UPI0025E4E1DE|nr:cation transporter [Microcella sp.]